MQHLNSAGLPLAHAPVARWLRGTAAVMITLAAPAIATSGALTTGLNDTAPAVRFPAGYAAALAATVAATALAAILAAVIARRDALIAIPVYSSHGGGDAVTYRTRSGPDQANPGARQHCEHRRRTPLASCGRSSPRFRHISAVSGYATAGQHRTGVSGALTAARAHQGMDSVSRRVVGRPSLVPAISWRHASEAAGRSPFRPGGASFRVGQGLVTRRPGEDALAGSADDRAVMRLAAG